MKRLEGFALIAIVLLASLATLRGAVPVSPELDATNEAERVRQVHMQAELSLHEKIQVGKERYQERQAFRQALVEGMRTDAQQRRAEINGTGPKVIAPEKSFDSTDIIMGVLILIAVYQVFRYFQSHELGSSTMAPALALERKLVEPSPDQAPTLEEDWKQIVAAAHLASEALGKSDVKEQEALQRKLAGISSVRLCLDISRTLILTVTEARIRNHLESVLASKEIAIDEKSGVMLALVVQGDFNEKNQTFTHKEKLVVLQSSGKKGLLGQSKTEILWGMEYTGFATDLEIENDVVTVLEVLTEMFLRERIPAALPEEEPASPPAPAEVVSTSATELNYLAVPNIAVENAAAKA